MDVATAREALRSTAFIISNFKHSSALKYLTESSDVESVDVLAENSTGHSRSKEIAGILASLYIQRKKDRLWEIFAEKRAPVLGNILRNNKIPCTVVDLAVFSKLKLGLSNSIATTLPVLKAVLSFFSDKDEDIRNSVPGYLRSLPRQQELHDELFSYWKRTESPVVEKIMVEQKRLPGTGAKEALLHLVTGNIEGYLALKDDKGDYFYEAHVMASETLRKRISECVMNSRNATIVDLYKKALGQTGHFDLKLAKNALLEISNDEDLMKLLERQNLLGVLEMLERWAGTGWRPTDKRKAKIVGEAVESFNKIGSFEIERAEDVPAGTVDLFEYWRQNPLDDKGITEGLAAPDPFVAAQALYNGVNKGTVTEPIADNGHWPIQLVNMMLFPDKAKPVPDHHVCWLSQEMAGIGSDLLGAAIACTPAVYEGYRKRMDKLGDGKQENLTWCLLNILLKFQSMFMESRNIVVEADGGASEKGSMTVEETVGKDDLKF